MKKAGILLLLLTLLVGCTAESSSEIGDTAYDFEVEDQSGNMVKLSDFEGKTVFVLAWATTWGECLSELPELHEVRENIGDDVVLMAINLSKQDNQNRAKDHMTSEGLSEIAYYDVNNELLNYSILGIPAAFYINPEGVIKNVSLGADTAAEILEKINE